MRAINGGSLVLLSVTLLSATSVTSVNAKSILLRSENVFGWQDKSTRMKQRAHTSSQFSRKPSHSGRTITTSPLKRSENVFGWQQQEPKRQQKGHQQRASRKSSANLSSVTYTNSSSKSKGSDDSHSSTDSEKDYHFSNQPRITPPNIKLQPRKKELWLPWPLGALRNDYYKFAEQEQTTQNGHQPSEQQQRLQKYYSDDYQGYESNNIFQNGKDWAGRMFQRGQSLLPGNRVNKMIDESEINKPAAGFWVKDTTTSMAAASATMDKKKQQENKQHMVQSKQKRVSKHKVRGGDSKDDEEKNHWDHEMILKYVKLQMKVRLRQLGYVGSDFSVHLPPAAPTLLLLYMLPSTQDPLRRLVKFSLTGATISWMHSEATKYRRFAPLPNMQGINVRRPDLLPFLPEECLDKNVGVSSAADEKESGKTPVPINTNTTSHAPWDPFQSFGTISSAYRGWLDRQNLQNRLMHQQRRAQTQSQLLSLRDAATNSTAVENSYALITGASRGIGRALAVELARYRIPLILVARDITKLTQVAKEIETYYNIPCRVLEADLSSPDCASRIYAATSEAGLKVDILINNAGVCTQGEMIEGDIDSTMNMLQVNVGSVVQLSHLYGKDMKDRRRGRMLFVSSMVGALPSCPTVAVYAATKSFEKSLASSLGREMERYGVGVTCLLPGAVKDTDFASRSEVESSVCFNIPGYAKSPELVAGEGVKALMLGYPEVFPGWENRIFAKMGLPMIPPRVAGLIGEYAWSPWQFSMPMKSKVEEISSTGELPSTSSAPNNTWKFRRPSLSAGNMLKLPDIPKLQMAKPKADTLILSESSNNTLSDIDSGKRAIESLASTNIIDEGLVSAPPSTETGHPVPPTLPYKEDETPPTSSSAQIVDESVTTESRVDGMNGGEVDASIPDHPSMLDQRSYDFRDRRLDY